MTWDPSQYERFKSERSQPFFDLLSLVRPPPIREGRASFRAVDLGCGTGELTREVHRRFGASPDATTVGYDSSAEMLAKSAAFVEPGLSFQQADVGALDLPEKSLDLLLSNAALQWLPDHRALFARYRSWLADGGQLAVQMPANFDHPSHVVARELAREAPFADALGGYRHHDANVLPLTDYATLLHALGFREQKVHMEVYGHVLASREEVIEWVKGTALTAYQKRLGALYPRFLEEYTRRLLPLLSDARPHFYPFKRIFLWARA